MVKYLKQHYIPIILGLVAFAYYFALSARTATWIFEGFDSGDWLAVATKWMVPQTYGSPLYMLLCRFVYILPGNLQSNLTVGLSVIPSSITVPTVYLIVKRVTKHTWAAITAALVALSAATLLSQSTIIEEYALAVMLLTLTIYMYVCEYKYRTVLFLGLAISVYLLILAIGVFWVLADGRWRYWLGKPLLVLILIGVIPYISSPILMALDTPRFLAGELSWVNLVAYYTTAAKAVVGTLSMADAPLRIWQLGRIAIMSFGLALVPLLHNIYKPLTRIVAMQIATIMFLLWFIFTCIDPAAWVFIIFLVVPIAILCGIALSTMSRQHTTMVVASAIILTFANAIFLNANTLTTADPRATVYYTQLRALPDGAAIVVSAGTYSMGLFYVVNAGKNLTPVVYGYTDAKSGGIDYGMHGFDKYLKSRTGVDWPSTLEGVQSCLDHNIPVYFVSTSNSYVSNCFICDTGEDTTLLYGKPYRVTKLTGQLPNVPHMSIKYE